MSSPYILESIVNALMGASRTLSVRKEEVNRLNVFPVPDGDTGTNMSLTLESVVENLRTLPEDPTGADVRRAISNGALMGARGNSGVITSQILRGLCEGAASADAFDTDTLAAAFARSEEVAFQAVRKPVEGTILTVLKDAAAAAQGAKEDGLPVDEALEKIVAAAYESVNRTPELLPVLKENNVVDAGGFGLAIVFDGFVATLLGRGEAGLDSAGNSPYANAKVAIEHYNDWEDSRYRYCNEFLVESDTLDREEALEFLSTMGDCELCVGANPQFKVHVHSNRPDQVLAYFLDRGQVSEVFIHNMQIQAEERNEKLAQEEAARRALGFVAVAVGDGNVEILKSLGVDIVVSGGQTMNPPTKEILEAIQAVNADSVIVLPDNKNIIMTAQSACELAEIPCGVVPTKNLPQAFAALFVADQEASLEENIEAMTDAFADVQCAEITTAIKDSQDAKGDPIAEGDVIGILDGSIDAVGNDIDGVALKLLELMEAEDADTLTILAGQDFSDADLKQLVFKIEEVYEDLEVDPHRGEQPLYPLILSTE